MSFSATLAHTAPDPPAAHPWPVELDPPDLAPWRAGTDGVPGFISRAADLPGPHLLCLALVHGNELGGAVALDWVLRALPPLRRGRFTAGFVNLAAFDRFDPQNPTASRFVDEDLNRIWDPATLEGPRRSAELDRAREIRPVVDGADVVLDLHSMLWPGEPVLLCGASAKGRAFAIGLGLYSTVVADAGHGSGRRLIDYARFLDEDRPPVAVLLEAGQHWRMETASVSGAAILAAMAEAGLIDGTPPRARPRVAEVTLTVTAHTPEFAFTRAFRGGDVIRHAGTVIARDGSREIRTPHDDCLLVMPSLRPTRGHTAVRLARFCGESGPNPISGF